MVSVLKSLIWAIAMMVSVVVICHTLENCLPTNPFNNYVDEWIY